MPRKKATTETDMNSYFGEFIEQARDLYGKYTDDIESILTRAEKEKIGVSFRLVIDLAESKPKVATYISFGENYTDDRVSQLDPDQGKFESVVADAKEETEKVKAAKKGR